MREFRTDVVGARRDNFANSYQSVSPFSCFQEGYSPTSYAQPVCQWGEWSEEPPRCVVEHCPPPPEIENGVIEKTGREHGATATYTCDRLVFFG